MTVINLICDECGKPAKPIHLATGRVYVDGEDKGQDADLCEEHWPRSTDLPTRPHNCKRVRFYWPYYDNPENEKVVALQEDDGEV